MPTLDWIGKKAVVNHHHEVPFHLLREAPELSCGATGSGNLLVEGDNLLAIKAIVHGAVTEAMSRHEVVCPHKDRLARLEERVRELEILPP